MTVLFPALCVSDSQAVPFALYASTFRLGWVGAWGQQEGLPGEGQIGLVDARRHWEGSTYASKQQGVVGDGEGGG